MTTAERDGHHTQRPPAAMQAGPENGTRHVPNGTQRLRFSPSCGRGARLPDPDPVHCGHCGSCGEAEHDRLRALGHRRQRSLHSTVGGTDEGLSFPILRDDGDGTISGRRIMCNQRHTFLFESAVDDGGDQFPVLLQNKKAKP